MESSINPASQAKVCYGDTDVSYQYNDVNVECLQPLVVRSIPSPLQHEFFKTIKIIAHRVKRNANGKVNVMNYASGVGKLKYGSPETGIMYPMAEIRDVKGDAHVLFDFAAMAGIQTLNIFGSDNCDEFYKNVMRRVLAPVKKVSRADVSSALDRLLTED